MISRIESLIARCMLLSLLLVLTLGCSVAWSWHAAGVQVRTVDIIECNTVYDEFGKAVFEQVIFWDWDYLSSDYRSVGFVSLADTEVHVRTSPPSCEWKSSIGIHRVNGRQYRKTNTRFDLSST